MFHAKTAFTTLKLSNFNILGQAMEQFIVLVPSFIHFGELNLNPVSAKNYVNTIKSEYFAGLNSVIKNNINGFKPYDSEALLNYGSVVISAFENLYPLPLNYKSSDFALYIYIGEFDIKVFQV